MEIKIVKIVFDIILNPRFLIEYIKEGEMAEQQQYDYSGFFGEINTKLRDIDEKQRLLKERVLLIGQNLIETRDSMDKSITELKSSTETMKQDIKKIKDAILRLSEEMEKKARKSEVELLVKQAKMFQPLEFARIEDIKNLIKNNSIKKE